MIIIIKSTVFVKKLKHEGSRAVIAMGLWARVTKDII